MYTIDKAHFISLIQKARLQDINYQNIQLAWQAIRLISHNSSIALDKILIKHTKNDILSKNSLLICIRFFFYQISSTIENIEQVKKVDELILIFRNQTLNSL